MMRGGLSRCGYSQTVRAGRDPTCFLDLEIHTSQAWQSLFVRNMFLPVSDFNIPRLNTNCFYCDEPYADEFHMFLTCPALKQERKKIFNPKVCKANIANVLIFKNAVNCETHESATFMKSILLKLNCNK
jgi:hypothetical protein